MEDSEIIALYRGRDQRAVAETSEKYGAYCGAIAANILGVPEDAEECVNDAFLAAWMRIPPASPECLRVFLGRITRNIAVSRRRRTHADKRGGGMDLLLSELEDCIPSADSAERAAESAELSELINSWLDSLDAVSRALFVRRYWHGESVAALAGETGCRPEQMTQKLLRLRRKLKAYLVSKGVTV